MARVTTRKAPNAPPGRHSRRVLTVRVLSARLSWLDCPIAWRDGRVVWLTEAGPVIADAELLARSQRALHKLRTYPVAAAQAFGDAEGWQRERTERLELAKRLSGLREPDLAGLCAAARAGAHSALTRLVELLLVEALSVEFLTCSPASTLARPGPHLAFLQAATLDSQWPEAARALAALAAGAASPEEAPGRAPSRLSGWAARARRWGATFGIPDRAHPVLALLRNPEGELLAQRWRAVRESAARSGFGEEDLNAALQAGAPPAQSVSLAEAFGEFETTVNRVRRIRLAVRQREGADPALPRRWAADLIQWARRYSMPTVAAGAVRALGAIAGVFLDFPGPADRTIPPLFHVLELGSSLEPSRRVAYLQILGANATAFWEGLPEAKDHKPGYWTSELQVRYHRHCQPVQRLLHIAGQETVQKAVTLGLHTHVYGPSWQSEGELETGLRVFEAAPLCLMHGAPGYVACVLRSLGAGKGAALITRLLAAFPKELSRERRAWHLYQMLDAAYDADAKSFPRVLASTVDLLSLIAAQSSLFENQAHAAVTEAAVDLWRSHPSSASVRLRWILANEVVSREWNWQAVDSFRTGLQIALALAGPDNTLFRQAAAVVWAHRFRYRDEAVRSGCGFVAGSPALRRALLAQFGVQPGACERVLSRLGTAAKMGVAVPNLLQELEPRVEDAEQLGEGDWPQALDYAPDLFTEAVAYVAHCRVLEAPRDLPAGLRRQLTLPDRLRREAKHLETRIVAEPERQDLKARLSSLRERLGEVDRLAESVVEEIRERLPILAAERGLDAARRMVERMHRARLRELVGPEADRVELSHDLVNAILLSTDACSNRKLLRELIRAAVRGNHDWVRNHPVNQTFLKKLAASGVKADVWLSTRPGRYRCAGAEGGFVRLRMETDPLHVLQMGNYFETCLSFGGCNSFSGIANACELNKRVIYARDAAGRVVGRKLIGLTEEGKLLGYRTYASLPDGATTRALRRAILRYCLRFARDCGLELAESGSVPRLMAQDWYDDDCVPWRPDEGTEDEAAKDATASSPHPRLASADNPE